MGLSESCQYDDCWLFHIASANSMGNKSTVHKIVQNAEVILNVYFMHVQSVLSFIKTALSYFLFWNVPLVRERQWNMLIFISILSFVLYAAAWLLNSFKREQQIK